VNCLKRLIHEILRRSVWQVLAGALALSGAGCEAGPPPLTADMPLHLEDHLDAATVVGSEVPAESLAPVEWRFDEPRPDWKPVVPLRGPVQPVETSYTEDALRVHLSEASRLTGGREQILGMISVDLPDYRLADWGTVLVRARTSDLIGELDVAFNLHERLDRSVGLAATASPLGEAAPVIGDGSVHTYAFRVDRLFLPERLSALFPEAEYRGDVGRAGARDFTQPLRELVISTYAEEPSSIEILSVTLAPAEAAYSDARVGVRTESQNLRYRKTLYTHAPGRVEYRVTVPEGGRLDLGIGILREDAPVTFRITATPDGGETETLLTEAYADHRRWAPKSVDLSHLAGRDVELSLEAEAERAGTVALWGAPTISGTRATERPNVVFYVLDGGSADHMSLYGYDRPTTPNLEQLAAEGAVFERAYSNSTHTEASTPSFVTSLHTSVLRGNGGTRMIPAEEVSMAERLHAVGYQTALLTVNPHAGWYSGLERGFDLLRDAGEPGVSDENSSVHLQREFWSWREAYPGEPYLIHLQATDVHAPWNPGPPFAGLFLDPERAEEVRDLAWRAFRLRDSVPTATVYAEAGLDPATVYIEQSALYDEAMAHQDYQIGQLVRRLKEKGEWENTLLIVGGDHSHWAGGLRDPTMNPYDPMFRSAVTRIPLLVVWPGRIAGGQMFSQPVSMIDVLPTILDLVGLPRPEVMQGQSLAPLLLGEEGWEPRPVILDEFEVDPETGDLSGVLEVIDGRWGASLLINPSPRTYLHSQRDTPLLLYDLWNNPDMRLSLHEERPDLVEHYTAFLEAQFEAHQSLAQLFTRSDPLALTPEQLQALRSLGYIN
jgi:arylsulfatase A-like enzyme